MAEAVYKRKIKKIGGNRNLFYTRNKTKVGLKALVLTDALPKWCAVPLASESRAFSHSLGWLALPTAMQNAYPLKSESANRHLIAASLGPLLPIIGTRPGGFIDRLCGPVRQSNTCNGSSE